MPPTNDPKHHHTKKTSPARRKSKPKFEVPDNTDAAGAPETTTAWVYRAEEVPAAPDEIPSALDPSGIDLAGIDVVETDVAGIDLAPSIAIELAAEETAVIQPALPAGEKTQANSLLVAGMGMFFVGVGTLGLMSLAAMGMIIAPVRMARNFLATN